MLMSMVLLEKNLGENSLAFEILYIHDISIYVMKKVNYIKNKGVTLDKITLLNWLHIPYHKNQMPQKTVHNKTDITNQLRPKTIFELMVLLNFW